jgi:transcriptional regulator with XRE-family HTH domain
MNPKVVVMPTKSNPQGPTGDRVVENLKTFRRLRGWSKAELSRRLAELGRPMSLDVITKIELGKRAVDVDDLVVLAAALDTSPTRLLLTGTSSGRTLEVTPEVAVSEDSAWRWVRGEQPLGFRNADHADRQRKQRFRAESMPTMAAEATLAQVAPYFSEYIAAGVKVMELVRKSDVGLTAAGELVNSIAAQMLKAPEGTPTQWDDDGEGIDFGGEQIPESRGSAA